LSTGYTGSKRYEAVETLETQVLGPSAMGLQELEARPVPSREPVGWSFVTEFIVRVPNFVATNLPGGAKEGRLGFGDGSITRVDWGDIHLHNIYIYIHTIYIYMYIYMI